MTTSTSFGDDLLVVSSRNRSICCNVQRSCAEDDILLCCQSHILHVTPPLHLFVLSRWRKTFFITVSWQTEQKPTNWRSRDAHQCKMDDTRLSCKKYVRYAVQVKIHPRYDTVMIYCPKGHWVKGRYSRNLCILNVDCVDSGILDLEQRVYFENTNKTSITYKSCKFEIRTVKELESNSFFSFEYNGFSVKSSSPSTTLLISVIDSSLYIEEPFYWHTHCSWSFAEDSVQSLADDPSFVFSKYPFWM